MSTGLQPAFERRDESSEEATPSAVASQAAPSRAGAFAVRVAAWMVIIGSVAVLVFAVAIPRVTGSTPYTVLTGSMSPSYPAGTLIIVRPTPTDDIMVGEPITFQLKSGESAVVTHRVIGTRIGQSGEREFLVKGDANAAPDPDPVRAVQVRGSVWYSLPYLGHLNNMFTGSQRQDAAYGIAFLLLGYAGVMFVRAGSERRRSRSGAHS